MRYIALFLLLLMCFSLAACPKKDTGSTDKEKAAAQDKSAGEEGTWENTE